MPAKKIDKNRLIPVFSPMRVKYKDVFHMKGFYQALHEWLKEHNWVDLEDGSDRYERFYGERIRADGSKELWIRWRMIKKPEEIGTMKVDKGTKVKRALTYYMDFDFHSPMIKGSEIIKDGKKFKADKGEVELFIRAFIEQNYLKEFEEHPILNFFRQLFAGRIYGQIIDERKKELYQEVYTLQNFIKQWFSLKHYLPYEETKTPFYTSQAYPSHIKK